MAGSSASSDASEDARLHLGASRHCVRRASRHLPTRQAKWDLEKYEMTRNDDEGHSFGFGFGNIVSYSGAGKHAADRLAARAHKPPFSVAPPASVGPVDSPRGHEAC